MEPIQRPPIAVWNPARDAWETDQACLCGHLDVFLGDLSELRYDAVWHGLRAADVGAPHARFRVFVVAYPRRPVAARTPKRCVYSRPH